MSFRGLRWCWSARIPQARSMSGQKRERPRNSAFTRCNKRFPARPAKPELLGIVETLNRDPAIHGILVQFPLPAGLDRAKVIAAIDPEKDVDGLHPLNAGRLATGIGTPIVPCTPAGCMALIREARGDDLSGLNAVVIGRSTLVGKPMAQLLLNQNCTVTVAHSKTRDLPAVARGADIVVAAIGRPEMVRGDWIKPGATVIDVGMNRIPAPERGEGKTRLAGDVDYRRGGANRRGDHTGAGRCRADDHRDADGQHPRGGLPQCRAQRTDLLSFQSSTRIARMSDRREAVHG